MADVGHADQNTAEITPLPASAFLCFWYSDWISPPNSTHVNHQERNDGRGAGDEYSATSVEILHDGNACSRRERGEDGGQKDPNQTVDGGERRRFGSHLDLSLRVGNCYIGRARNG
jgi:hypothetical protein